MRCERGSGPNWEWTRFARAQPRAAVPTWVVVMEAKSRLLSTMHTLTLSTPVGMTRFT
jgi:hypothetical protein